MARQPASRTGYCQGCNHPERVRIERLLAAGASIKVPSRMLEVTSGIGTALGDSRSAGILSAVGAHTRRCQARIAVSH